MSKLMEEIDKATEMGFGNERYFTARVLREAKARIVELEAEVERLREGIRKHRLEVLGDPLPCQMVPHDDEFKADRELWSLLETEAGGADRGR